MGVCVCVCVGGGGGEEGRGSCSSFLMSFHVHDITLILRLSR